VIELGAEVVVLKDELVDRAYAGLLGVVVGQAQQDHQYIGPMMPHLDSKTGEACYCDGPMVLVDFGRALGESLGPQQYVVERCVRKVAMT
jgi:hypothetical protein